ncbi:replication initiation protein [Cetobacterium sp.]|uniref:replication initiation protein n=1 Tax=Cetobacterium sp. TaxID=2071632 RepID=UPI003F3AA7FB
MGKIVEYDSKLNNLNFGKFKEKELDLFFAICYKLKEQGLDEITLSFQELKELSNYSRNDVKRLISDIESTYTKLLGIKLEIIISPKVREKFVLFTKYRIDEEKKEMTIQLHKEYSFVLNDIDKFTKFDLIEFSNLKSTYARNMFRLLKQFDNKKNLFSWYEVKIEIFKDVLGIPSCYKMINIDKKILVPIMEQLKPLFHNLKLEKIKKGVKVVALKFTWTQKKKIDPKIIPIKIKKGLGQKELEEDKLFELERDNSISQGIENTDAENPLWVKFLELSIAEQASVVETVYQNYILECGANGKIQKLAFNASKKSLITKFLENNREESFIIQDKDLEFTQTKIYTVEDIPSEKLLDKNGNKLKGMLLVNRINKILSEMNKTN